jgi:hypothetical protein
MHGGAGNTKLLQRQNKPGPGNKGEKMKDTFRNGAAVAVVAVSMLLTLHGNLFSWDQLAPYVYNSHSVITYDAAMAANAALRASRAPELANWSGGLYSRMTPRIGLDPWPMGVSELSGGFYPERHLDDATFRTLNRLEEGNTVADKPRLFSQLHATFLFDAYCGFFTNNMKWASDRESCKSLALVGVGMPLHFNRGYTETGGRPELWPAAESCRKGVDAIRALTREAWAYWKKGRAETDKAAAMREYEKMYLFAGMGMHAVEDAFAPAHMQRSPANSRVITDLCYYYDNAVLPPSTTKACSHGVGDGKEPRDSIYFRGDAQHPDNSALRSLATKAAQVYLTGFANIALDDVKGGSEDLEAFLSDFLITGRDEGKGYLDCTTLER